ncbi:MAG: dihydrofolate reductase [Phocaeicola sp.]|uniref:dihydrofolate reductase n=1 Tax=Phocaeicola TaxID=909656 RepID=UPI00234F270C|nr:dihydrofolate reductase [Phocaeicola oris]MCE2617164.1 dihydrofolate reductase [Phocaeicola oris]
MPHISIIVAIDKNNAIGKGNDLLYHLPNDLKRFKALTTGNTVVMGRKTFESLPKGALPNRRNIVLSRQKGITFPGAEHYISLEEALKHCSEDEKVFIIGGASVYKDALPLADELRLTKIDDAASEADAYFPPIQYKYWEEKSEEKHPADERHTHSYMFVDYIRKK